MTDYTHKKSLRHTTDEQFSDGTTVDGNRVDRALDELVGHYNNIPPGDVATRFTETKYVFGYKANRHYEGTRTQTGSPYFSHHFPWLPISNTPDNTSAAATIKNRYTVKGVDIDHHAVKNSGPLPGVQWQSDWDDMKADPLFQAWKNRTSTEGPVNGYQYAWTMSFFFSAPAILDDLSVALLTDGTDDMADFISHPAGSGTDTVSVVIMVDDHFSKEDRTKASIELAAHRYDLNGFKWTVTPHGLTTGMQMEPGGLMNQRGRLLRWRDLNIPVHPGSRVRLIITIPWAKENEYTGLTPSFSTVPPFHTFDPSGCLTVLEEVTG